MSVQDHDMDPMHHRPPDHLQQNVYPQHQYYTQQQYDPNYVPMHHDYGQQQQQQQQQQWYPQQQQQQQQQQQYQYRMPQQDQYQYHNQMGSYAMPMDPKQSMANTWQGQHNPQQQMHHQGVQSQVQHQTAQVPIQEPIDQDKSLIKKSSSPAKKKKKASTKSKIKNKTVSHSAKSGSSAKGKAASSKKRPSVVKKKEKKEEEEDLSKYADENVKEVVVRMNKGCECSETSCFKAYDPELVLKHRLCIEELTKTEHDMYLMGVLMACTEGQQELGKKSSDRKNLRARYRFLGREVCKTAFLYLENTTLYQLKSIRKHMMDHGVSPRTHGNHGKIPHNTFSFDTYQFATRFLEAYIEKHGKEDKTRKKRLIRMPKNVSLKTIHEAYHAYGVELNEPSNKIMSYSALRGFVKDRFPHLKCESTLSQQSKSSSTSAQPPPTKIESNLEHP